MMTIDFQTPAVPEICTTVEQIKKTAEKEGWFFVVRSGRKEVGSMVRVPGCTGNKPPGQKGLATPMGAPCSNRSGKCLSGSPVQDCTARTISCRHGLRA